MKVSFLGTSSGWALPRLGCTCNICSSSDLKDKRSRPALLIDEKILIDAGPDVYSQLIKRDISKIELILITHAHFDHILGLFDLSKMYNNSSDLTLIAPLEVLNGIRKVFTVPFPFKIRPAQPYLNFKFLNYQVTYFPVDHTHIPCFGVKVKGEKLVSYIPDFYHIGEKSEKVIKDTRLLVMDGSSFSKEGQSRGHQNILQGIELGKRLKAKDVYFTHIGHKTDTHENLSQKLREMAGHRFNIAYDELELTL